MLTTLLALTLSAPAQAKLYDCTQTTLTGDPLTHLVFKTDPAGVPARAQLTFDATGVNIIGPRLVHATPNFWGGYWYNTYLLDAYKVGWVGNDKYTMLVPTGPLGSVFDAMVITEFGGGVYGNTQIEYQCTKQ